MLFLFIAGPRTHADPAFSVADLGTLGGTTSTANGVAGQGVNASGMIVGSSTASDNADHAFLYADGQMFDLNALCDLAQSDFRILTIAKAISDSCLIIGEGITNDGNKHAFLLTPLQVEGGKWSYACCQWVWIPDGGGWWWETNCGCYRWHGGPGRHPPCPPEPPPCWWLPLPCPPPCHRPTPTPTPSETPSPTPRHPGQPTPTPTPTPRHPGQPTPTPTPNYNGIPVGVLPTPTPTPFRRGRGGKPNATATPKYTGHTVGVKATPTPRGSRAHGSSTPRTTSHGRETGTSTRDRRKQTPTPKP